MNKCPSHVNEMGTHISNMWFAYQKNYSASVKKDLIVQRDAQDGRENAVARSRSAHFRQAGRCGVPDNFSMVIGRMYLYFLCCIKCAREIDKLFPNYFVRNATFCASNKYTWSFRKKIHGHYVLTPRSIQQRANEYLLNNTEYIVILFFLNPAVSYGA